MDLKKNVEKSGIVVYFCDPGTWEAETGGSQFWGQSESKQNRTEQTVPWKCELEWLSDLGLEWRKSAQGLQNNIWFSSSLNDKTFRLNKWF